MAWQTLCNEFEILAQHLEVTHAIEDTSSPIPGYLFGEINALTYMDYGNICKPLVKFLVSKLEANSPFVSFKVLKLLFYLVKNGHTEMVEEVKYHEVALKEATGFHGPPDDFHGKTYYEDIRKTSKEILEYVFSENIDTSQNVPPPAQSELSGYGSSASMQKLSGFGYSVKSQKSVSEKVSEGITTFVEKLLPQDKDQPSPEMHLAESLPQYKPIIISKSINDFDEALIEDKPSPVKAPPAVLRSKQKVSVYKPGRPGGGWDDSEDEEEQIVEAEIISKISCTSGDSIEFSKIELKEAVIDWTDEHKVVVEFTVNEELSKLDLTNITSLCQRCSSLNCDKVLSFLMEKLAGNQENVQLRSLIFVELLLFHDIISLESTTRLVLSPVKLLSEKDDVAKSVKIKAKKVSLIIQNLNNTYQKRHPKQITDTPIKCNS